MTLQQLRCIVAVSRQRLNITAAARALYMTQPGVSRHVRMFEDEIGVRVFSRSGPSLSHVTTAGKAIIEQAEQILHASQHLQDLGRSLSDPTSGTLAIGTTHTQARYILPDVISRFVGRYPKVSLQLHQGTPQQVAAMADEGLINMVIATEAIERHESLVALPCYSWDYAVILPCDHPLARQGQLDLQMLSQYPIITYIEGFTGRATIDQAFAAEEIVPNITVTAADADIIKTYVRNGIGIGIVANMAYDPEVDADLCVMDGAGLFPSSTTRLGIRRDAILRRFDLDFIEYFAPHLRCELVERAVGEKSQAAVDALFTSVPHYAPRLASFSPSLATA
ncbi:MAG: LysR substrate-binding domain-containing protein [Gammaproteobacteria bacterium]|nr:LysR substrate-binding domain-containing protein [Gammaproteobacteria bacterium]MCW8928398.1 LysR substrate-binding domain-containing protein [Gammaproteobacteria bacterium]MCW8957695.1 LysR substrate-binding domain-containing protein [Gammaproteobacteria bacterium]MCW8972436.1 LysR substrate-binding domain-containing protein [Gammaproteobacteria bacterium]MCW8992214.1 LysR substrate-binding domain-containing protein [Gammaproteobacteria bacterium]